MAEYPGAVYAPRAKENLPGIVYDAAKKTIGYVEDVTKLDDEVVAVETELDDNKGVITIDIVNKRVGIGIVAPEEALHVVAPTGGARMLVEALNTESAVIKMKNADANSEYAHFVDNGAIGVYDYTNAETILNYIPDLWDFQGKAVSAGQADFTSLSFPVVDIIRETEARTAIYGGAKLERVFTGLAAQDNSGIGFYFKTENDNGDSMFAGMFGGALFDVSNNAEVGGLIFAGSWRGADPGGKQHLVIKATGINTGDVLIPNGNLDVNGVISSATLTFALVGPTDDLDVSGVNTLFINAGTNPVTIGGFVGGVDGQVLNIVIIDPTNNVTLEHAEGGGNQDILLHKGADETIDGHYGGWTLICHAGVDWHDASHAKHI